MILIIFINFLSNFSKGGLKNKIYHIKIILIYILIFFFLIKSFNMDLFFQDIKLLFSNLEDLKNNLNKIIELKQKNTDILNSIETIENILLLIKPFMNSNNTITSEKLKKSKESLKSLMDILKNYFNSNEEINNLHEINRLIKSSKEILKNYEFNPPSENLIEDNSTIIRRRL